MGWRVRRNDLSKVIRDLPKAIEGAVDDIANDLVDVLEQRGWKRTGTAVRTIEKRTIGPMAREVTFGWYLGRGFYTGFQEFGTVHQGARPVVRPAALEAEPVFTRYMEQAIEKACRT